MCYNLWYNGIMHPRCCRPVATGRQHRGCIIPQAVTHNIVLLKMGEIIARKHVELIGIINKPLLLHLVACLCYLFLTWCIKEYVIFITSAHIRGTTILR